MTRRQTFRTLTSSPGPEARFRQGCRVPTSPDNRRELHGKFRSMHRKLYQGKRISEDEG